MKRRFAYYAIMSGNYSTHVSTWPMALDIIEEQRALGRYPKWQGCHNLAEVQDFFERGGKYERSRENDSYEDLMQEYLQSRGKNKAAERVLARLARAKVS